MVSTRTDVARGVDGNRQVGAPVPAGLPRVALPTRERKPGLIAVAVLLVVGMALVGVVLVNRAAAKADVLIVHQSVSAGHVIEADDLGSVQLSGGIRAIAASNLHTVVGQVAAVDLVPGQVVNRDMLTAESVPPPGKSMIGLSLAPGQLPGDGIAPGDAVQLVAVPSKSDADSPLLDRPEVLGSAATVYAARPDTTTGGNMLVTVIVPSDEAARLATYGSAGKVALIKLGR
jgi:hypothetical protein